MRKNFSLAGAIIISMLIVLSFTACESDPPSNFDGSITFTDGIPDGAWAIYVTPNTVTSLLEGTKAMDNCVAGGAYTGVEGKKVWLLTSLATGGPFNKNGTYNIVLYDATKPLELKYKSSVKFFGGNASFTFKSMTRIGL